MARVLDEELKKAFTELHEKTIDTKQMLNLIDIQIESLKRVKQRSELTQAELRSLPDKTKTYESVGRMFLLEDISTIKTDLNKRTKTAEEKIKTFDSNKEYLQKNLSEFENNIREMVWRKKQQESS